MKPSGSPRSVPDAATRLARLNGVKEHYQRRHHARSLKLYQHDVFAWNRYWDWYWTWSCAISAAIYEEHDR